MLPARTVYLELLGCRLNEAEVLSWRRQLAAAGHRVVASPADADAVVLNTCAVTAASARKSRERLRQLRRRSPSAALVVTGCQATLAPADLGADLIVPNAEKSALVPRLLDHLGVGTPAPAPPVPFARTHTRAFVKVQDGCNNRCTFCIVATARGAERSRPVPEILAEIQALRQAGYQEVVLTGVHLAGYGTDQGASLEALVAAILAETDVPRLRLGSLEPWDLSPAFFGLWADARLCPHLHLPLQSGSDRILRRMARRCTVASFRALTAQARARIPDLSVTTDLIVGFPGETADDFAETLAMVEAEGFGAVHAFSYSPRAGTPAARLPGRCAPAEVARRHAALVACAAAQQAARLAAEVGRVRPVLWERSADPGAGGWRRWQGYTPSYQRVLARLPQGVDLENRIVPARLLGVVEGARLEGSVLAEGLPAR